MSRRNDVKIFNSRYYPGHRRCQFLLFFSFFSKYTPRDFCFFITYTRSTHLKLEENKVCEQASNNNNFVRSIRILTQIIG